MNIGFIGFGEAGFNIAKSLKNAGAARIFAFDINAETFPHGEKIKSRIAASETILCESNRELAARAEIIFSTVTADSAIDAANETAAFLAENHFYADLNSVSPATKIRISEIVAATNAKFVEAAVMSPVPPHGHRVPMLLGGEFAKDFTEIMFSYGMNLEVVSQRIGQAAAVKMCRSIVVKGLEALLLECALAAVRYEADERVFATLDESFPMQKKWSELADYMVGRVLEHGTRRAAEMREVAAALRSVNIEPVMAEAVAARQEWGGNLNLPERFGGQDPLGYRAVVQRLIRASHI